MHDGPLAPRRPLLPTVLSAIKVPYLRLLAFTSS